MPPRNPNRGTCPPDHPHGKSATCYAGHSCGCDACRERNNAYTRWKRRVPADKLAYADIPALGTHRRLQALACLGYSLPNIGHRLGMGGRRAWVWLHQPVVTRRTAARVARLYDELCMTPAVGADRYERMSVTRTKRAAIRSGWVPPLAWDDIDNDPYPNFGTEQVAA